MSEAEVLSTDDLRNRMFEALKKRGFVDVLKTQLRNRLVAELKDVGLGQKSRGYSVGGNETSGSRLCQTAVDSLIADYLKYSRYNYTLSIFLPEAGATQETLLSVPEVLQLLRISSQSKLYAKLINKENTAGMLWQIVKEVSKAHGHATIDTGCQTDTAQYPTISTLEEQLAKVDARYESMESTQLLRTGAVEERILSFQRQLEERYRSELNMAMARFKENELTRLKITEREQHRKEIDKAMKELEYTYRTKYDAMVERERNAVEQLQRQQEIAEKELFSQRQKMLSDIEALQQREVQLRRQQEVDMREKSLMDEKTKTREELAKRREESARRAELEHDQRVRDDVNKFKLEEQTRYVERLTNVEFRETRIKENERRLDDQLQDVSNIKVELRDKRSRVNELEAELIRTRHELLSSQKQAELLAERTREMVDYQMLKEDNAVMRRELDNTKLRLSELMRDNMVERQKQEDLLREMGVQAGKPTPEVALLRQQIDQLQSRHRTEIALNDHEKLQLQQRLEDEIARNKELVMKCEQQTWQQKQFGIEAADMREQLFDSHLATRTHLYRRCSDLDRSGSLNDYSDVHGENVNDRHARRSPPYLPNDESYSSDLVQDTKNRLRRLETEADALEKNYRDFQFRVVTVDPVLGTPLSRPDGTAVTQNHQKSTLFGESSRIQTAEPMSRSVIDPVPAASARSFANTTTSQSGLIVTPSQSAGRTASVQDKHLTSAFDRSDNVTRPSSVVVDRPVERAPSFKPNTVDVDAKNDLESARVSGHDSRETSPKRSVSSAHERSVSSAHDLNELPQTAVRSHSSPSDVPRQAAPGSASTSASRSLVENVEPVRISLDDAWKSTVEPKSNSESEVARLQREKAEDEEFERKRKQREEERKQREEEAWLREQRTLEELSKKRESDRVADDRPASASSLQHSVSADSSRTDVAEQTGATAEPKIDPALEKYMSIIQKQREQEKQAKTNEDRETEKVPSPFHTDDEISVAEEISESSRSAEKDDFW